MTLSPVLPGTALGCGLGTGALALPGSAATGLLASPPSAAARPLPLLRRAGLRSWAERPGKAHRAALLLRCCPPSPAGICVASAGFCCSCPRHGLPPSVTPWHSSTGHPPEAPHNCKLCLSVTHVPRGLRAAGNRHHHLSRAEGVPTPRPPPASSPCSRPLLHGWIPSRVWG